MRAHYQCILRQYFILLDSISLGSSNVIVTGWMSLLCFHYHWNSDFGAWNKFKNTPKMGKFQAFLTLHIVELSCFFFILFYFIFFVFCFAKILFSSLVGKMLNVIHSREYTFLEKSSTCHDAMQHILCMLVFFPTSSSAVYSCGYTIDWQCFKPLFSIAWPSNKSNGMNLLFWNNFCW